MNRQGTKRLVKISIFGIVALIVIGYAIFAFHDFIQGPEITITQPGNGTTFSTSTVEIVGTVVRSQNITLNGKSVLIDDKGNFDIITLLAPGYNAITLDADDRFGRTKEYRLELVYKVN